MEIPSSSRATAQLIYKPQLCPVYRKVLALPMESTGVGSAGGQRRQKGAESHVPAQFSPPNVSHSPKSADLSDKYNSSFRDTIPE